MYSKLTQTSHSPTKRAKKAKTSRKKLITELDDLVRTYLQMEPDECVTCHKKNLGEYHPTGNPTGLQVGHYISRRTYALRWELRNCHRQCAGCNIQHNVNPAPYTKYLLERYGSTIIDELIVIKNQVKKLSIKDLEELKIKLKEQIDAKFYETHLC